MIRKIMGFFNGVTDFAWVLVLGVVGSLVFATKIAINMWSVPEVSLFFCLSIWVTVLVTGVIVSFALAFIFHKLFEEN